MTAKLTAYARAHGYAYEEVSLNRAMALALAAAIVHAITPTVTQWGNSEHPPLSDRILVIITGFSLPPDSWFWLFVACLLIGIMHQAHRPLDIIGRTPQALAEALIARVR